MPEPLIDQNKPAPSPAPDLSSSGHEVRAADGSDQNKPSPDLAQRPDYIPESYWDAEKGAPKLEDFGKAFGELSQFKAEVDAKLASVPEKADGYAMPDKLVDDEVAKIIPAGHDITIDEKSPLLAGFREYAHANKLTQEQFAQGVQLYLKQQILEEKQFADARDAELKKLGANGPQRQKAVNDFLVGMVGEADAKALLTGVYAANQFEAFERLQLKVSNQGNILPLNQKRENEVENPATNLTREQRMYPTMQQTG